MECPICGSDDVEILNSKQKSSKKKIMEEYLLKCESCGHVFKDIFSAKKPEPYRLIISEQDKSHKTTIDLSPSDELKTGDILLSDLGQVEVTSIEVNDKRVNRSKIEDIDTIKCSDGNTADPNSKAATYKVAKAMGESFRDKTGGTVCKELKGIETGKVLCSCPDCIRAGVEVVEEILKL